MGSGLVGSFLVRAGGPLRGAPPQVLLLKEIVIKSCSRVSDIILSAKTEKQDANYAQLRSLALELSDLRHQMKQLRQEMPLDSVSFSSSEGSAERAVSPGLPAMESQVSELRGQLASVMARIASGRSSSRCSPTEPTEDALREVQKRVEEALQAQKQELNENLVHLEARLSHLGLEAKNTQQVVSVRFGCMPPNCGLGPLPCCYCTASGGGGDSGDGGGGGSGVLGGA